MTTIKDVAERAQVSISTVSRVLTGSTRVADVKSEAVRKAMAELNYQPNAVARALVGQRTGMLGLMVNSFADPFFGALMSGVEQEARLHGMQVIATEGHHDGERERDALCSLLARRCDALIIHALSLSDTELLELIGDNTVVVVNRHIPVIEDRCLWFDNFQAGYMAAGYLLECGHSQIGWIGRNEDIPDNRDRFAGFMAAMVEHGLMLDDIAVELAPGTAAGGYQAACRLLSKHPKLSAMQAYNDVMAGGCLRALHERNLRLPEEFSVMGIDDVYLSEYLYPQLTTIRYPIETIGQRAVQMICTPCDQLRSSESCFQPTLIERVSVSQFSPRTR